MIINHNKRKLQSLLLIVFRHLIYLHLRMERTEGKNRIVKYTFVVLYKLCHSILYMVYLSKHTILYTHSILLNHNATILIGYTLSSFFVICDS